jgi:hypothetical protein
MAAVEERRDPVVLVVSGFVVADAAGVLVWAGAAGVLMAAVVDATPKLRSSM